MKIKLIAIGSLLALATPVLADVAYSNFNATYDLHATGGYSIGDWGTRNLHYGFKINAQASGDISNIVIAARTDTDNEPDEQMVLTVWDDNGNEPGNSIWTGSVKPGSTTSLLSVTGVGTQALVSGNDYWVTARSLTGFNTYFWSLSDPIVGSTAFASDESGGTNWSITNGPSNFFEGAMEVNVVPEPATLAVLGLGGLALLRRKRKSA